MECFRCGASDVKLFDVISDDGIIKLCKNCLDEENAPIIQKPDESKFQMPNKNESIYNRLSKMAGLDAEEHKKNIFGSKEQEQLKKQEITLRDLVDKKFDNFVKEKIKKRDDLIENFHWIIMRARRNKKLSISQLAKKINESEKIIKMAEQGVLPEDNYNVIQKLETILEINILKPEIAEQLKQRKKQLGFDDMTAKNITISDLQEMEKKAVLNSEEPYWKRIMAKIIGKKKERQTSDDLEINSGEEEVKKEQIKESVDDLENSMEFEEAKEIPMEFNNTGMEIETTLDEKDKKIPSTELTQKDIDDLIFGKRK
ncbi:hypothetical protein DRN73_01720 [Candidatus Pacearchaeota archaeon]|nr:MAG: hypothetical protein DRN73_01720 [Candidatus Pacearchaeota archaeon]